MKILPAALPEILLVEPRAFEDARGAFVETWHAGRYGAEVTPLSFVQDNVSVSRRGVVRGLHFQYPRAQGKLVGVLAGAAFDVAVDVRCGSPTFGRWVAEELSDRNRRQLWIPAGFAHGFLALEDDTHVLYKTTDYYARDLEGRILWCDASIGIQWPLTDGMQPLLSPKDAAADGLAALVTVA